MSFSIDGKKYPVLYIPPEDDPVFVLMTPDGSMSIATAAVVMQEYEDWSETAMDYRDVFHAVYVRLPGSASLRPCSLSVRDSADGKMFTVHGSARVSRVLWQTPMV